MGNSYFQCEYLENYSVPESKQIQYNQDLDYLGARISWTCATEWPALAGFLDVPEAYGVHCGPKG